jgi:hypothetical protein
MLEPKWSDRKGMQLYLHKRVYVQHADTARERKHIPGK